MRSSPLSVASFVVASIGFFLGFVPFLGVISIVGIVLGVADRKQGDPPGERRRHSLGTLGIIIGIFATIGVGLWAIAFFTVSKGLQSGSCPHVYAFDGEDYRRCHEAYQELTRRLTEEEP